MSSQKQWFCTVSDLNGNTITSQSNETCNYHEGEGVDRSCYYGTTFVPSSISKEDTLEHVRNIAKNMGKKCQCSDKDYDVGKCARPKNNCQVGGFACVFNQTESYGNQTKCWFKKSVSGGQFSKQKLPMCPP